MAEKVTIDCTKRYMGQNSFVVTSWWIPQSAIVAVTRELNERMQVRFDRKLWTFGNGRGKNRNLKKSGLISVPAFILIIRKPLWNWVLQTAFAKVISGVSAQPRLGKRGGTLDTNGCGIAPAIFGFSF